MVNKFSVVSAFSVHENDFFPSLNFHLQGIAGIKRPKKQLPQRRDGDGGERTVDGAVAGAAVANSSVVQPSASAAAASGIMPRAAAAPRPSPVPAEDSPMAVGAVAGTVLPSRSAAPSFIRSTADGQRALDDLDQVTGQMASLGVGDGLRQRRRVDRTSEDQVGGRSQSASKRP